MKYKFVLIVLAVGISFSCSRRQADPIVIMLSLDAFRWDYQSLYETPNIDQMTIDGVQAESMQPSFPSKTFPNHYTIATGLYPDHHGIVQNNFYDPDLDREFRLSNREAVQDSVFWGGEPIWETAERQGVRAASYFWVGTENNDPYHPSRRKIYDQDFPLEARIDSVISWLYLPEEIRPQLIMFYYHEPDGVSHDKGPISPETRDTVQMLDQYVGMFREKLSRAEEELGIKVNFILTSDHGMGHIPTGNYIVLSDVLDTARIERIHGGNPVYLISPEPDYYAEALQILQNTPHLSVYEKSSLPAHYHYGTNPRIEDFIVEADSAWGLAYTKRKRGYSVGTHGYDPANKDMHGIFYAVGPAFKKGYQQNTFENVCVYPLIAEILHLKPAKTDGSLDPVKGMLKSN